MRSELKEFGEDALDSVKRGTTSLESAAQSAMQLSHIASTQMSETITLVKSVTAQAKAPEELLTSIEAIRDKLEVLSIRAVNEQLTAYPRKVAFAGSRKGEFSLTPVERQHSHLSFCGKGRRLSVRLACERQSCQHKVEGNWVRYLSPAEYQVPGEIHFDASLCHDPKTNEKVEKFFELLEISGVIERGAHFLEEFMEHHQAEALAILAVKATLPLGGIAAPVFVSGVIYIKHSVGTMIQALRENRRDADATQRVRELFLKDPYGIADMGGPGHVQFGEWIKRQIEEKELDTRKAFGGLTRWLDPATNQFAWLCPDCAYDQIARYRTSKRC
jgi:hypothetical protein